MQSFVRRALTASVATVCLAGLGIFTVPAAVAAINQANLAATAQSFSIAPVAASQSAKVAVEAAARDDFEIVEYTLVQWPVAAGTKISSYFGYRSCANCSTFHSGDDFVPGVGTPVEAIADGVVVSSPVADGSWGVHVTIEHNIDGVIVRSSYAHMQNGSMTLAMGDTVSRGQVLGLVGSTGQSNGPHLHFTLQDANGELINPLPWMTEHVNVIE